MRNKRNFKYLVKRKNDDLYKHNETIAVAMQKRRLKSYGHLVRTHDNRLTKIFKYISRLTATTKRVKEVKKEAVESRGGEMKTFEEKPSKFRVKFVIPDAQRKIRSEGMERLWEEKKRLTRKP